MSTGTLAMVAAILGVGLLHRWGARLADWLLPPRLNYRIACSVARTCIKIARSDEARAEAVDLLANILGSPETSVTVRPLAAVGPVARRCSRGYVIDLTSKLAKPLTVVATVAVVVGFLFVGGHVNWLLTAGAWTYWNSEFTMIGLALLWVYLLRHEHFTRFRNTILLANLIGLGAYVVMPVAPSWMVLREGFGASISHSAGFLATLANPFAAMPSLHAADALIVGVFLAVTCRRRVVRLLWALWPAWVWFCVIATANYSVTDVVAGIGVALTSVAVVSWTPQLVRRGRGHTVLSGIAER